MSDRNTAAGNRLNQFMFLGPDGFPIGKTFSRPAAGTSTNGGMLQLYGAKQASPTVPTPAPVVVTGEDGNLRHEYNFPSDASRGFEVQIAVQDLRTAMLAQNMPLKSYAGGQVGYEDIAGVKLPSICAIIQSWAIDEATGVLGWSGDFIPSATLAWLGRDGFNERAGAIFRYYLTPQQNAYEPWGYTIFDNDGVAKNAAILPFRGFPHPVTLHAYTGNNSATVFPVDFAPVDVASAMGVTERVDQPITSVQTTTPYGITFTTAPTANGGVGGRGVMLYQRRA